MPNTLGEVSGSSISGRFNSNGSLRGSMVEKSSIHGSLSGEDQLEGQIGTFKCNIADLIQTPGEYIVLDCGTSSDNI